MVIAPIRDVYRQTVARLRTNYPKALNFKDQYYHAQTIA